MENQNAPSPINPELPTQEQATGNGRVIQPTVAIQQEINTNPELSRPNVSNQVVANPPVESIYNSVPTLISDATRPPDISKPSRKKPVVIIAILIVLLGGAGWLWLVQNKDTKHSEQAGSGTSKIPKQTVTPTDFEKKLAKYPDYLAKVKAFSLPVYVPKNMPAGSAIISAHQIEGKNKQFVMYGVNSKYGQGLVPGSYGVAMFTLDATFNPPSDCGVPLGGTASSKISCSPYAEASKDMPAYIYHGQQPGGITNTSVPESSYITLYVQRGQEVITIQASGASPAELYEFIKDMKQINPLDLPEDSSVSFG